jgi:peptidoglycan/xylan/chitin deacetylase (PgdA/CDA1 family)
MKDVRSETSSLSRAEWVGIAFLLAAVLLSMLDVLLSAMALGGFLVFCIVATFLPHSSFYLPVISRGISGRNAVALTFDDGPDPLTTPGLLRLLSKHGCKATFFVTGNRASANPELIREILRQGHTVGNHSYSHDFLFALRGTKRLLKEIESTEGILENFGIRCLAFRPPVGISGPRLREVLRNREVRVIGFSCRALDGGNRWISRLSKRILKRVRADDIVLLHDVRPKDARLLPLWLKEVESLLLGLEATGLAVLPLSEIIGRPVMVEGAGDKGADVG